jgi:hypothetical protein
MKTIRREPAPDGKKGYPKEEEFAWQIRTAAKYLT